MKLMLDTLEIKELDVSGALEIMMERKGIFARIRGTEGAIDQ